MKTLRKTQNTGTAAAPGRCARRFFWILGALGRRAAGRTGGPVRSPCGPHGGRPTHATAEDRKNTQNIHKKQQDTHKNIWKTPKTTKHTRRSEKKNLRIGKKLPRQTKIKNKKINQANTKTQNIHQKSLTEHTHASQKYTSTNTFKDSKNKQK